MSGLLSTPMAFKIRPKFSELLMNKDLPGQDKTTGLSERVFDNAQF